MLGFINSKALHLCFNPLAYTFRDWAGREK
jgi:hypothetical protein